MGGQTLLVLVVVFSIVHLAWMKYCFYMPIYKTWTNEDYVSVNITPYPNSPLVVRIHIQTHIVVQHVYMDFEVTLQGKSISHLLLNNTVDYCNIVSSSKRLGFMMGFFVGILRNYKGFPQKCPIQKGSYFIDNFPAFSTNFPVILAQGKLIANLKLRRKEDSDTAFCKVYIEAKYLFKTKKACPENTTEVS